MIKYNFKQLLTDKEFSEDRKVNYEEISKETGISKQTLSKIAQQKGYNTSTVNLEKLCQFFGCTFDEFMTIVEN